MLIDPDRLLADLETLRGFGREGAGVVRPAFSEAEIAARLWSAEKMREAGLSTLVDPAGNVFGLPPGDGPWLLLGSHTDSQLEGGWLDGAYGVIAALEAARALQAAGRPPVAVVNFQDEEGRFGALTGSNIWAGNLDLATADALQGPDGRSFGEARAAMPGKADQFVPTERFKGFLEIHIEQGPWLVEAGEAVGVVERIVGIGRMSITFTGEQNHAGTTPMARRRDAFQGLAAYATRLNAALAPIVTEATVWTIGSARIHPGAPSIVPGKAVFSVQWRDAEAERLEAMRGAIRETAAAVAAERGLGCAVAEGVAIPPRAFDAAFCDALAAAAETVVPGRWRRMPSGALHDTSCAASRMPAAMLFVPSIGGISHSFAEDTAPADLVAGAETLAQSAARLA
ncbi:MAG: hydantoinase/carbamoylase family amidase [Pseudomonadota bacterium]